MGRKFAERVFGLIVLSLAYGRRRALILSKSSKKKDTNTHKQRQPNTGTVGTNYTFVYIIESA